MTKHFFLALTFVAAIMAAPAAKASTSTGAMNVSAIVNASCIVATTPMAFGNYSGATLDQASAVTVTCTSGTPYSVALETGTATADQRVMAGQGGQTLDYAIYRDAGRTSSWGANAGANTLTSVGSGLPQVIPAYGRIPQAQSPAPGLYQDTVVVTLTY